MKITSADATSLTQSAIIQYLEANTVLDLLQNPLSVNVEAVTDINAGLISTVSLWYTTNASLPDINTGASFVTALDANGHPSVVAAGWTELARGNLGNATFTILLQSSAHGPANSFGFTGWDFSGTVATTNAKFFAIVVGTAAINNTNFVAYRSVSLVPGTIPTQPAPQAINQVLFECQRYYQKSFLQGTVPAQAAGVNTGESYSIGVAQGYGPIIRYPTPLRVAPTNLVTFYNPVNADAFVYNFTQSTSWLTTTTTLNGNSANGFPVSGTQAGGGAGDIIGVHWTADARLGVI
jgi:hypothetical protein